MGKEAIEKEYVHRGLKWYEFQYYPIGFFRRWEYRQMRKMIFEGGILNKKILEIGANTREYFKTSDKIDLAINGLNIEDGIKQKNETYDIIVAEGVLEHINPLKYNFVMDEIKRTLKIGGKLCWSTPNKNIYRLFTITNRKYIDKFHINERTYNQIQFDIIKRYIKWRMYPFRLSPELWGWCEK